VIQLRIAEAAALSILEQADYYRQALDDELAARWEEAVDEAIHSLLSMPDRGTPCRFRSPELRGIRWILVPGFVRHMVFYRHLEQEATLLVVQVLHGARDIDVLLSEEDQGQQASQAQTEGPGAHGGPPILRYVAMPPNAVLST